jgi:glycosyltransferase involved in cell wall biosynthesis
MGVAFSRGRCEPGGCWGDAARGGSGRAGRAGDEQPLTVLGVAYPLAPVSMDTAGGAEQILAMLDRGLVQAGHRSIVIACEGSRCAGELVVTPLPGGPLDEAARARAQARCREAITAVLARTAVDIVHLHGIDFASYVPGPGPAALATLHLPPEWYPAEVFALERPRTHLCCVSASQARRCPPAAHLVGVVENGVDLEVLRPGGPRRSYAFALGRICPEKGFHRALAACRRAGVPMLLAGEVYPYPDHERYFREGIAPLLDRERRFLGPVGLARKRRLLAAARCLLVPSEVPETSSLVAMEALACGIPVITLGAGALSEIVEHGRTGYVVADEAEMAAAIRRADRIDPVACRRAAEQRFSAATMVAQYLELYRRLSRPRRAWSAFGSMDSRAAAACSRVGSARSARGD